MSDSARLSTLDALNWQRYVREKPDSSVLLAETQLALAREAGSLYFEARAHTLQGTVFFAMGDRRGAIRHHEEALRIAERIGSAEGIASELNHLGKVYLSTGQQEKAIGLLTRSIEVASANGDLRAKGMAIFNVGNLFEQIGDPETALKYYEQVLDMSVSAGDSIMTGRALSITGGLLFDMGQREKGVERLKESFRLMEATGSRWDAMEPMINLGVAYLRQGDQKGAIALFDRTLVIARELQDPEGQMVALSSLADAHLNAGSYRPARAIEFGKEALRLAESMGKKDWQMEAAGILYGAYKALDDPANALAMHERLTALKDSILSADNQRALIRADVKFGFQKQVLEDSLAHAAEVERLEDQGLIQRLRAEQSRRQALVMAATTLLLLAIASLLFVNLRHRQRLAQKEKSLHEKQVDELLQKNEITAMHAMFEGQEKERDRVARDLHDRVGSMLGNVKMQMEVLEERMDTDQQERESQYKKVYGLLVETVGEVRRISHDMVAGTLARFGLEKALEGLCDSVRVTGRLAVELRVFGLENRLERGMEITVYRIVQELVGNALKHAKASELSIDVTRTPGRLSVIVSDNGMGFDTAVPSEGMGLANVRKRVATIGGELTIDSTPGKGTTVSVECVVVE